MFSQEAFSIFSLPPALAMGQLPFWSEEEHVQLGLEATKGKDISTSHAATNAKIHRSPICNPLVLQDFLSNKMHVNLCAWGDTVSHCKGYKLLLMDADASFCSCTGHIIDMATQAYLCSCIMVGAMTDISMSILDYSTLQTGMAKAQEVRHKSPPWIICSIPPF
jgi:hypothetical protein